MSLDLATDSLKLVTGESEITPVTATAALAELIKKYIKHEAVVVCWQRQRIIWGLWKNGQLQFSDGSELDETLLLEIRLFNEQEELHLLFTHGTYTGRYVVDGTGTKSEYVDSLSRLWGKKSSRDGEYVVLKDAKRFLTLCVPCREEAEYYGLVTRNYVGCDCETGQAGYTDYRFVKLTSAEGRT